MADTKIFASIVDDVTKQQVRALEESDAYRDCVIRVMPDCHAGKGCTIGTVIKFRDRVVPNTVGVDIGCLDKDTEVLTPSGWIKISEYASQDIMQYDPNSDTGYFKKPAAFIKLPCDSFWHFKNSKGLDQMVSDEHRMLVFSGKKLLVFSDEHPEFFIGRKSIEKGYYRFKTCFNVESDGVDISDALIRVDVMVQADGRIREYGGYNHVELHFRKKRKIERAKCLLNETGIAFSEYEQVDGTTVISFRGPKFINKDLTKYYKASRDQLAIIAKECLFWDGHEGYRSFYSSTSKENADLIQFAMIATNTRASMYAAPGKDGWNQCYNVIRTRNQYVGYNVEPVRVKSEDGFKYCFTTSTGYFLARRNNYTFLTGNCGMLVAELGPVDIDLAELDKIVTESIPCGFSVHPEPVTDFYFDSFVAPLQKVDYYRQSIGTLGGGNHFIELDTDDEGNKYLVIHSGSRNLGVQICDYWQKVGVSRLTDDSAARRELIDRLTAEGRQKEIGEALKAMSRPKIAEDLAYIEGDDLTGYLNDMALCQDYAEQNRYTMVNIILEKLDLEPIDCFQSIHNYIDIYQGVIRKGAISAAAGQRVIIPMNMRDGSLLCVGRGNKDWLCSAPHGAGRIMSRKQAVEKLDMADFKRSMEGIFTTSVCEGTIDEAPMVYKPMEQIMEDIKDTVFIEKVIKPLWNFKAKTKE